jgi:histidinol phosphatase-like PHP family hydrolase
MCYHWRTMSQPDKPQGKAHRINLHVHSTWSDGAHVPRDLVRSAVVHGVTHIGISDHYLTRKLSEPQFCVGPSQVATYAADIRQVAADHARWVDVLVGLEVDWSARAAPYLPALWPRLGELDYLLFEYVGDASWIGDSLEALLELRPSLPLPVGLAHNDLGANFSERYAPEALVELLDTNDLFLELSTAPQTGYYRAQDPYTHRVWTCLAESGVRYSVGSDAHGQIDAVAEVDDAHRFLEERGLEQRLITRWWDGAMRCWREDAP